MTTENQELAIVQNIDAALVFAGGASDDFLDAVEKEVKAFVPDVSTPAGRAECKAFAFRVTKTKTKMEKLAITLKEDWQKRVKAVTAEQKKIDDRLTKLAAEARQPLTNWENRDKDRTDAHEAVLAQLSALDRFDSRELPTVETMESALDQVEPLFAREWEEYSTRAEDAKTRVIRNLTYAIADRKQADEAAAEERRRQQEEAARKQKERDEQIAAEAAEKAKREAEEKAEAERLETERKTKAAADVAETERKRIEQEKLDAEKRVAEAEAAVKANEERHARELKEAEEKRQRDIEEAKKIEADKQVARDAATEKVKRDQEEADRKRAEDLEHRKRINNEILGAMQSINAFAEPPSNAEYITLIRAIAKGEIPNVKIIY